MIQRKIIAKTISKNRTTKNNWIMFDCSWLRDEAMRSENVTEKVYFIIISPHSRILSQDAERASSNEI